MFKLTNGNASALFSPVIRELMEDKNTTFPIEDGFKILDIMNTVKSRLGPYNKKALEIVAKNSGVVNPETGKVVYKTQNDRIAATRELEELNNIEMEYPGELLNPPKDWPPLSLACMTILSAIIKK